VARWRKLNPEKVKVFNKKSHLKRLSTPEGRLNHDLSRHMSRCLSKTNQTASQLKHSLPYTISELRAHIERQFPPGMSWEKRSEWHIDHIIPLSSFKFTSSLDTEFKAAWALSNLRPLWKKENLSKGKKKLTLL
jgi:5-methylcytosine-specific restriction endonuclease McrA